ncbi:MAG: type II secretion system protein GspD, partial [Bdellovibrionales bacterium]
AGKNGIPYSHGQGQIGKQGKIMVKTNNIAARIKGHVSKICLCVMLPVVFGCADANVPGARNVDVPSPTMAQPRPEAVNEKPDSVLYLPLGSDVLVPEAVNATALPKETVGPFELRSETLAGALQLILADYEIPMAFETNEGLTRTITVTNLKGPLDSVVDRVCSLADLYCAYEDGLLVVKDTQTFTVTIPPIGDGEVLTAMASGIQAITGTSPITESGTRTIIYEATNRTAKLAERYFQRMRASTALIVFQVYIWEVELNTGNNLGIDWTDFGHIGGADIAIPGGAGVASPISIGLPTFNRSGTFNTTNILEFLSTYGAVKTISQPQVTMLSGATATLRAADTENYVSSLSRTSDNGEITVSTEVDSVDTGFTLAISSDWDNATVYGDIEIELQENKGITDFTVDNNGSTVGLPQTTERELTTQIRIRPGDSLLIAGLIREADTFDKTGPGFNGPIIPSSRGTTTSNRELVFLLKPRVIVYTAEGGSYDAVAPTDVPQALDDPHNPATGASDEFPLGSLPVTLLNPSLKKSD